jgi:homoserine kinase
MPVNFRAAPVRVRVPATSANLGPGFDALGLALGLYDDVVLRAADSGLVVDVHGEGADDVSRDENHLVVRAVRAAFEVLGGQPHGLEVVCANRIPHARGLGSSAAAIVSGIVAARALLIGGEAAMDDAAVLELATALEGHPDNVAACLLGGLTIAWTDSGGPRAARLDPHPDLRPVAFVPDTRASTAEARRALPAEVPHADAAFTAGRAALLTHALTAFPALLLPATEDRLHQRYRAGQMRRSASLVDKLRADGVPAVISGAGPTVLAFAAAGPVHGLSPLEAAAGSAFTLIDAGVDHAGAAVLPLGV